MSSETTEESRQAHIAEQKNTCKHQIFKLKCIQWTSRVFHFQRRNTSLCSKTVFFMSEKTCTNKHKFRQTQLGDRFRSPHTPAPRTSEWQENWRSQPRYFYLPPLAAVNMTISQSAGANADTQKLVGYEILYVTRPKSNTSNSTTFKFSQFHDLNIILLQFLHIHQFSLL